MNNNSLYYTQHGSMTNPGEYAWSFDGLPAQVEELVRIVQGLTVHIFWAQSYGLALLQERKEEVQLRTMQRRLARTLQLDPRPISEPRDPEKRLVGNCRDHSLLLVSMLRHLGIPARARCGFGAYFLPGHYEDHWVAEYWHADEQRWVLVDAQLDALQCRALQIAFNPLDVPRDQFIVGGKAWKMCRDGVADPDAFGIFEMHGLGFVRGNMVRDLAALNKLELLPWDCWGVILRPELDDPLDLIALDQAAALIAGNVPNLGSVRACYAGDARFRMDGTLLSYINGEMTPISIAQ